MGVACCESEDTFDMVYNLVETPVEGHCDVYLCEGSSSLSCDIVLSNPFDHSHVSSCAHSLHFSLSLILICPLIIL